MRDEYSSCLSMLDRHLKPALIAFLRTEGVAMLIKVGPLKISSRNDRLAGPLDPIILHVGTARRVWPPLFGLRTWRTDSEID